MVAPKVLISVVGPTAIGKTALAIALAKHFDTEIISADSRQFYKEMAIGTAVPTPEELDEAKHHFIQHKSIFRPYSVGDFEREAIGLLNQLYTSKNRVVMVGGSGLYIDAVTKGLDTFPTIDPAIRFGLNKAFMLKGIGSLQEQLKVLDPAYFETVDKENPHRLIRALEICLGTGKPYSSFLSKEKAPREFKVITIGINAERPLVYEKINARVDHMCENGLLEEVKALHKYKNLNALQTVGYQELFRHLDGEWDLDFAISEIKKNTRRFAKRQLTWFRKNQSIHWVSPDYILQDLVKEIEERIIALSNGSSKT